MNERMLKLAKLDGAAEIFHTLQGEGVSTGVPSIFIRSSLCNLHCSWCDTAYTWNWEGSPWAHEDVQKFKKEEYMISLSTEDVADVVTGYNCKNVILTGGEPLLQQEGWSALIERLRSEDPKYRFEVETNGTQVPDSFMSESVNQWNVSVKLSNSGNEEKLRINEKAMQFFKSKENAWFKFVIQSKEDLLEVQALETQFGLVRERILLMPEGRDEETLKRRRLWLADVCRDHGYRFSDRLHVQLWGAKRGV